MQLHPPRTTGARVLPLVTGTDSSGGVLNAGEFERLLERERHLADRGTRVFTLLVLQRLEGSPLLLDRLSRQLVQRLRSTDVVGQLDRDRLAVLLTDTDAVHAHVVAVWIDRAVGPLALRMQRTMYVYPSAPETNGHARRERERDEREPPDGHDGGRDGATDAGRTPAAVQNGNGNGNGHASGNGHEAANGHTSSNGHNGAAPTPPPEERKEAEPRVAPDLAKPAHSWKVEDLWSQLSVPTPFWKRAIDVLVSGIALLLLFPFFVLVAIAIKLDSPGPLIFRQERAGRGGRPFVFYKFRSMFLDAEARRAELEEQNEAGGPVFKIRNDPRITRVGRILRRWSIDEMPQLWNVFIGDFSLVGPRPPMLNELPGYERWHRRRLNVSGGLTCIWQVSGRNEIAFEEWMRMDMRYIAGRSPLMDLRLLAQTVTAVLSGRGAY